MEVSNQNILSVVLADEQLTKLREEIYQMILMETKRVRADMLVNVRYLSKKRSLRIFRDCIQHTNYLDRARTTTDCHRWNYPSRPIRN